MATVVYQKNPWQEMGGMLTNLGQGLQQEIRYDEQKHTEEARWQYKRAQDMTNTISEAMELEPGERGPYRVRLRMMYGDAYTPELDQELATAARRVSPTEKAAQLRLDADAK